jgi:hypothetical protein
VYVGLRHIGPGFGCDVHVVTDVERFPKLVHSGFVSAISHLNKISSFSSKETLNVTITAWSIGWISGVLGGGGVK